MLWYEEPVTSDDLEGLRLVRDRAPGGKEVAAGEYGYDLYHFRRLLEAGAVDVVQADATRCLDITGFLKAAALCEAHNVPVSAHTAPALHIHPCAGVPATRHIGYFHAALVPDRSWTGNGLELRDADAERYAA